MPPVGAGGPVGSAAAVCTGENPLPGIVSSLTIFAPPTMTAVMARAASVLRVAGVTRRRAFCTSGQRCRFRHQYALYWLREVLSRDIGNNVDHDDQHVNRNQKTWGRFAALDVRDLRKGCEMTDCSSIW